MKRIIRYGILLIGILGIVSCSNGGECVSCVNPQTDPIVVTPITPPNPAIFDPTGGSSSQPSNKGGTSPNYISKNYEQIAVPDASTANTSYIVYNLPTSLSTALAQDAAAHGGPSSITMNTLVSTSGQQIAIISTPGPATSSPPNVYIVVPKGQPIPNYLISGGESNTSPQDYVLIFPVDSASVSNSNSGGNGSAATSYSFIVPFPISTNILPAFIGYSSTQSTFNRTNQLQDLNASPVAYQLPVNIQSCSVSSDSTTSVAQTIYNGTYYIAAGTANGNVCIVNADQLLSDPNTFIQNFSWTANLANGYTTRYTPRGQVLNMSFPPQSSNNILGFWNINTQSATGANSVYRITGQNTGQGPTGFVPTSFWNVTINSKQYSPGTGSSVTFNNSPTNAFSMLTDSSLNVFIGSTDGKIYKLTNGGTTWSMTVLSIGSAQMTGPVSLSPTTNPLGNGVIATGLINGSLSAFTIQ